MSHHLASEAHEGWWERAACQGLPQEWFITPGDADDEPWDPDPRALAFCLACDVRPECLADAVRNGDVGTRGGTSAHQRRQLRRIRRRQGCPGCSATETATIGRFQYCLSCGLSWRVGG